MQADMPVEIKEGLFFELKERDDLLKLLNKVFVKHKFDEKFVNFCKATEVYAMYAILDGIPVGIIMIQEIFNAGKEKYDSYVTNFGVLKEYRRKGIGTLLYNKMKEKHPFFYFEVYGDDKKAQQFYKKMGAKECENYERDEEEDVILMVCN
jgi:ribosomal protein S18 acetylase RimI-like enzyme